MQIHVINPNTSKAMSEKIAAAARQAAKSVDIVMHTNPHGAPSLESHFEEALATPGVLHLVDQIALEGNADAILIACFGDPAVNAVREMVDIPVMGIAEAAIRMAATIGHRFSIVTTLARTLPMAERILWETGLESHCNGLRACNLPVMELERTADAAFDKLATECRRAVDEDDIDALVLGCAGMADLPSKLSHSLGIPVIDGVAAGVQQLESLCHLGLKPSKNGDRAYPPVKQLIGPYDYLSRR